MTTRLVEVILLAVNVWFFAANLRDTVKLRKLLRELRELGERMDDERRMFWAAQSLEYFEMERTVLNATERRRA